jgi:hypothetical protein
MMKKLMFIAAVLLLSSCATGVKTTSSGLENEAFLEFVGTPNLYHEGISVTIDNSYTFTAEVKRDHADRPKGKVYAISTGKHDVSVSHDGRVIYQKTIFVSARETRKIVLQ